MRVRPLFENGRDWVMYVKSVPVHANSIMQCQTAFAERRGGRYEEVEAGTVCVECLRNGSEVLVSVVLPNGYPMATGRGGHRKAWFTLLKSHLRDWLAMSFQHRIIRACLEGRTLIDRHVAEGKLDAQLGRTAVLRLDIIRREIMGELLPTATRDSVTARFHTWVAEVAQSTDTDREEVLQIIAEAVAGRIPTRAEELGPDPFQNEFHRFLDI